jgi:hypothetical protein
MATNHSPEYKAMQARKAKPLIPVATYMVEVLDEHRDPQTDEVDMTALAEDAADHFDLMGGPPGYETPEWVFEMAFHVAERDEARRTGHLVPAVGQMINSLGSEWF